MEPGSRVGKKISMGDCQIRTKWIKTVRAEGASRKGEKAWAESWRRENGASPQPPATAFDKLRKKKQNK
jgi:hypothetical protein